MALCVEVNLVFKGKSDPYDQFVRYRRWHRNGYTSSAGKYFYSGKSIRQAIVKFKHCQGQVANVMMEKIYLTRAVLLLPLD
jgi:hypothetical protein